MDRGQTIIISEMQHHDVQDERSVEAVDGVGVGAVAFRAELQRNGVLPGFELGVELADGGEEFAVGLAGSGDGVESFVDAGLDLGESAVEAEEVHCFARRRYGGGVVSFFRCSVVGGIRRR